MRILLLLSILILPGVCFSTTWVESKVDDPIKKGRKCSVSEPASSGSYIYHWPSKYDQVFWPYTDSHSIWFCKKSGYVSFMSDFENLTESEKENIKKYLKKNKLKNPSEQELLEALEKIYKIRKLTPEYSNMLSRIFARWHQRLGNTEVATKYRRKAYSEIEKSLSSKLTPYKKLEYLYLAANYARLFNEIPKSEEYLSKLRAEIDGISEPELTGYGEYLNKLSEETKFIIPGQSVEPKLPEDNT